MVTCTWYSQSELGMGINWPLDIKYHTNTLLNDRDFKLPNEDCTKSLFYFTWSMYDGLMFSKFNILELARELL